MKKRILSLGIASLLAALAIAPAAVSAESVAEEPAADPEIIEAPADGDNKIVVGATPSPHAEILEQVKEALAAKGWELEIVEYTDYVQPNMALEAGDLDANYFQHLPYLESFNEENKTNLVSAAVIHYEPFGIFPGKTASLEELPDGAKVGVPNDTTNEARALNLLEANGLIKLKEGVGLLAAKTDIIENEKNLDITEIEAAQLPRSLPDLDIAAVNGNYAIDAGLSVGEDALAIEEGESLGAQTYGNVIAVRAGEEETEKTQALVAALESSAVRDFINETYAGAVVPLF